MEQAIYLVTGVMASGKSTVSELLAFRLGRGVHLRGDVFRRMIVAGREEMSPQPSEEALRQLDLRYRLSANAAKDYFRHGFSVVLQDNYYGEALPRMAGLLNGFPLRIVVLCPRPEIVKQRERERGKTGYGAFTVESLYESFLRETPRLGFWLDTSGQTPQQSVAEILRHFGGN